jgi:uncharacterized membrane protein
MGRLLVAGESWIVNTTHIKGFDHFTTTAYEEGIEWLRAALERGGHEVDHMPAHAVPAQFPATHEALARYDGVILSDIGANSIMLHPDTFVRSLPTPDRLELLADFVAAGGGLAMIGGYMSFGGFEGRAAYAGTAAERVLPVQIVAGDDRVERPAGARPEAASASHPVLDGLPATWPAFLGYNRITAKAGADVLLRCGDDDFLVAGRHGAGRTLAFASDCAPHWAPPGFLDWEHHDRFWGQAADWLCGAR